LLACCQVCDLLGRSKNRVCSFAAGSAALMLER
jgi:hypothetical protein